MNKWQRIKYMPATPLYAGKPRVTESAEHRALSRRAAADGMVLLKNEDKLLPLRNGAKVAVFGKACIDYVKGGGGSGDVTVAYVRTLIDGLREKEAEGKVRLFEPLIRFYEADVAAQRAAGKQPGFTVEPELPDDLLAEARAFADTAIISICRFSSEGWDRTGQPFDGDYFLSHEECGMVEKVKQAFPRIVVVLNAGGIVDTLWFKDVPGIQAALHAGQAGMEGGAATADVLTGDVCPSGRLTDTYAENFAAYPSSANFNDSPDYVEYEDDIYVGYRYFSTIPGAAERVLYPFGFGLSYTSFRLSEVSLAREGDDFTCAVTVTNTGGCAGREVVQLYAKAPQGRLGKPERVLVAFAKTGLLIPSQSETLTLRFSAYAFASYDDLGKVEKSAYVLEKGEYAFYLGENVRDAARLSETWTVEEDRVLQKLSARVVPHDLKRRLRADGSYEALPDNGPAAVRDEKEYYVDGIRPLEWVEENPYSPWLNERGTELIDVVEGRITLDEFMALLSTEQKVHLLGGQPNRGPANTYGFGNLPLMGIPNVMTADGPAGLRITPECGVNTTAFPTASLIACTWDVDLACAIGRAGAEEVAENGFGVWLTPAINIHRSPLCGRNFEYYSEDPLLAGKMASGMIRGIQSMGVAASLKHFCANNKETNRLECDSRVSERALREIYLKGFEICVKEAAPWTVMSSYNPVNGCRASQNRELLTDILRGEWGFDGLVTTDWYTHGEHWKEVAAGNDIKMGRGSPEQLLKQLKEGKLSLQDVNTSVERLLRLMLKLA